MQLSVNAAAVMPTPAASFASISALSASSIAVVR